MSVGIVVIACAALLVLDRIGRAQVATRAGKRRRGAGSSRPDDSEGITGDPAAGAGVAVQDWAVVVERDRLPWWRRLLSGAGLAILVLAIAVALAVVVGAVAAAIYLGLESATA